MNRGNVDALNRCIGDAHTEIQKGPVNKTQSSKLNALLAVKTLLQANPTLTASLVALDDATEELVELILSVNTHAQVQSAPSGVAAAKADALVQLGDAAYEVAGGVLSFAEKSGDLTLAGRAQFSRTAVTAGSSNAIVVRCQGIIDAATENLSSLGDHGVTQAKVNAVKQKLKAYDGLRVLPRQAKAAGAAATRQLERLFPEADRLLEKRIDKLVWQFRESAPEFYEKYQVARAIVDAPTQDKEKKPSNVVPNPNTTPDANTTPSTPDANVA